MTSSELQSSATILESQEAQVEELSKLLRLGSAMPASPNGIHQIEIPNELFKLLAKIVGDLASGKSVAVSHANSPLTTQQAANMLGVSRQYFVRLLDEQKIPYHKVGSHRRIYTADLLAFRKERDKTRHEAISELARQALEAGAYDDVD